MSTRIIQFGTSRFLQAHVDLFVHEARVAGQAAGPITVVKTTSAAERSGRIAAFAAGQGFPVRIRGIEGGQAVDRQTMVTSVDSALTAGSDWDALAHRFAHDAGFVISNTGDTGYGVAPGDVRPDLLGDAAAPQSFPAILLKLLWLRWRETGAGIVILPCELVHRNGTTLHGIVAALARDVGAPAKCLAWIDDAVVWADTLVDRIVSAPIEPVGAVAEPYALWAIGNRPGLVLPCAHPAIVATDDLEVHERLKLHILNLGHTVLAQAWLDAGAPAGMTVRAMIDDAAGRTLQAVLRDEVLPGFAARGLEGPAAGYVDTTLDRFRNPYLDHLLADIAQHHEQKIERRIATFLEWSGAPAGAAPTLARIVAG